MANYPAGAIEANGTKVEIQVDDGGSWCATYDGRNLTYPTREKLEASIKRLTKRAAVAVEVSVVKINTTATGATGTRATATGIHGANGNVLVTLHHGGRRGDVKEQISIRYRGLTEGQWFGGDVTDEQIAEYAALRKASYDAQQAVKRAEERFEINLMETVERAIALRGSADDAE